VKQDEEEGREDLRMLVLVGFLVGLKPMALRELPWILTAPRPELGELARATGCNWEGRVDYNEE
jgi:hypothetical protein